MNQPVRMGSSPPAVRPPVALGCLAVVALVAVLAVVAVAGATFLESGSNGGYTLLDEAASYAPGSLRFAGEQNVYVARLTDGTFLALADLDAANRANAGRRCRVVHACKAQRVAVHPRHHKRRGRRRIMPRDAVGRKTAQP